MADNWKIKVRLEEAIKFLSNMGYEVVTVNLYGSQNYGLDTENSDIDLKAVVLPSIDDIINNTQPVSTTVEFKDGLIDVKDIRLMFENYKKQNTNYLETLFTPYWVWKYPYCTEWTELRRMANDIARADEIKAVKAMYGMALEKLHALCKPYPSKLELIDKYGYDSKQLSHIIRLYTLAVNYIEGESYADCLIPNDFVKELCIKIKTYNTRLTAEKAQKMAETYMCYFKVVADRFLQEEHTVNNEVYHSMDEIKARIIKKYFRERL